MTTITHIEPLSLAKIFGVLYAVFGLIYGLLVAAFSALIAASGVTELAPFGGIGVGVLIGSPIGFGIGGFIGGLLMGALYNVVAGWIGGVRVETDSDTGAPLL